MENYLSQIAKNTQSKKSIFLVVSDKTCTVNTTFNPPIHLNPKRQYEMALVNLETYYSFPNVDDTNNTFKYSSDGEKNWKSVKIPVGCYEIESLNAAIKRLLGSVGGGGGIEVKPNLNTLKCILSIKGTYAIDFNVKNSLRTLLGFAAKQYSEGVYTSESIVNILRVNSILVHTDIVTNSYMKGEMQPVIYNFFPNVSPGEKIISTPKNLIYLPITVDTIYRLKTWLTDQDNQHLDLRGEVLTIRYHLREC